MNNFLYDHDTFVSITGTNLAASLLFCLLSCFAANPVRATDALAIAAACLVIELVYIALYFRFHLRAYREAQNAYMRQVRQSWHNW